MAKKNPELSLIVPTYNERENLPLLVKEVHRVLSQRVDYEMIIVDDNSPDGTGEVAERLANRYPVRAVHREGRLGLASAVVAGFHAAKGKILGVMDADLQHPPRRIVSLLKAVENGADIAVGSRYVKGGKEGRWALTRKAMSRGARFLADILVPKAKSIKDPMSGFFLLRREVIEGVSLDPVGYKILLEILAKGSYRKVVEVPYAFAGRRKGESKLGLRENLDYFRHLIRLARARYEDRPLVSD